MINLDHLVSAIYQAVLKASDSLADKNLEILNAYFESSEEEEGEVKLIPKTTIIQYPRVTADGVEVHDVHVPIIALLPMNQIQISEVKVRLDLDIFLEKDALKVNFTQKRMHDAHGNMLEKGQHIAAHANASLEVVLSPSMPPEGLKLLIDGYEKALRAQIPG